MVLLDIGGTNETDRDSRTSTCLEEFGAYADSSECCAGSDGDRLRHLLRLYFYPAAKWRSNNCLYNVLRCGLAAVEVIKLVLLTVAMLNLGFYREEFNDVVNHGELTMRHILLESWTSSQEKQPYPPIGTYALYERAELESHVKHAIEKFYNYDVAAVGLYVLPRAADGGVLPMELCIKYYTLRYINQHIPVHVTGDIFAKNYCFMTSPNMTRDNITNVRTYTYNFKQEILENNASYQYSRMLGLELQFQLRSVRLSDISHKARCLDIHAKLSFEDQDVNGQILINLRTVTRQVVCESIGYNLTDAQYESVMSPLYGSLVFVTLLSVLATMFASGAGIFLCMKTRSYVHGEMERGSEEDLIQEWTDWEYVKFFKLWEAGVMFGDTCILYAMFSMQVTEQLQLLFSTFYNALFDVLAYSICVVILFTGYVICGYIVLGPYHIKFSTLSITFDSLFGMMIGNEIFVALVNVNTRNSGSPLLIWWFSRFYIYTFVGIFNILAKSLLTAILISAYRVITARYEEYKNHVNFGRLNPLGSSVMRVLRGEADTDVKQTLQALLDSRDGLTDDEHYLRKQLVKLTTRAQQKRVYSRHDGPLKRVVFDEATCMCNTAAYRCVGMHCVCRVPCDTNDD